MNSLDSILLIDDDKITNFLNERTLRKLGFMGNIIIKNNGAEGLDYIDKCIEKGTMLPQIIFIDINMPVMNGFEFLMSFRTLSPRTKNTRVVVLTSSSDKRDIGKIKEIKDIEYITKPLSVFHLKSVIQKTVYSEVS